mmetsp:Transcript_9248/g.19726  ORF Transcript_9248/g.19726 Transcript_9248/m.19726 type:complete len:336 (-) Transcript_9248:415-1422(-)
MTPNSPAPASPPRACANRPTCCNSPVPSPAGSARRDHPTIPTPSAPWAFSTTPICSGRRCTPHSFPRTIPPPGSTSNPATFGPTRIKRPTRSTTFSSVQEIRSKRPASSIPQAETSRRNLHWPPTTRCASTPCPSCSTLPTPPTTKDCRPPTMSTFAVSGAARPRTGISGRASSPSMKILEMSSIPTPSRTSSARFPPGSGSWTASRPWRSAAMDRSCRRPTKGSAGIWFSTRPSRRVTPVSEGSTEIKIPTTEPPRRNAPVEEECGRVILAEMPRRFSNLPTAVSSSELRSICANIGGVPSVVLVLPKMAMEVATLRKWNRLPRVLCFVVLLLS